ncbi:unnamed protein product, partial [marine sediment metagenome]
DLLIKLGFHMDEEPMVDGSVRMASFVRAGSVNVDYTLEVNKDVDNGLYASDSDISLQVDLFKNGNKIPLLSYYCSSNAPAPEMVKGDVNKEIKPKLKKLLI